MKAKTRTTTTPAEKLLDLVTGAEAGIHPPIVKPSFCDPGEFLKSVAGGFWCALAARVGIPMENHGGEEALAECLKIVETDFERIREAVCENSWLLPES
eukprot:g20009.t1